MGTRWPKCIQWQFSVSLSGYEGGREKENFPETSDKLESNLKTP